jgi:hypothetical protein
MYAGTPGNGMHGTPAGTSVTPPLTSRPTKAGARRTARVGELGRQYPHVTSSLTYPAKPSLGSGWAGNPESPQLRDHSRELNNLSLEHLHSFLRIHELLHKHAALQGGLTMAAPATRYDCTLLPSAIRLVEATA